MPTKDNGQYIGTTWELVTYDVWGNARDGWEVNNAFRSGEYSIPALVRVYNIGTEHQFVSAELTDSAIKKALGITCKLTDENEGDDCHIYLYRERDGYPLCELHCVSHESLSPIKPKPVESPTA